jgi:hypothetical protein
MPDWLGKVLLDHFLRPGTNRPNVQNPNSALMNEKICLVPGQLFTLGNPEDVPAEDFVTDQDVVRSRVARLGEFPTIW